MLGERISWDVGEKATETMAGHINNGAVEARAGVYI